MAFTFNQDEIAVITAFINREKTLPAADGIVRKSG